MKLTSLAMVAALGTTAIVQPTPAKALFGFVCVPTLYNCWCTYLKPCPVIDIQKNYTLNGLNDSLGRTSSQKAETNKVLRKQAISQGVDLGGSIPGFDAIGFDLSNLAEEQVNKITDAIDGITNQLKNIKLSASDLAGMLSGQVDPTKFMTAIQEAGLNAFDLQSLGVSNDSINGLLNGSISQVQFLDAASSLGLQAPLLKGIGITPEAIQSLASGDLSIGEFESVIQSASGLNLSDLSGAGIDLNSLNTIAGSMDKLSAASLIGELGIGDAATLSNLKQIEGMISGELDSSQIFGIAGSMGLNVDELSSLGVSPQTLEAFRGGSFSAGQLLEISNAMGISGDALNAFGIDPKAIMDLTSGNTSPDSIIRAAQQFGLTTDDLAKSGLSLQDLISVSQSGNMGDALRIIEGSGIGTNPLSKLGITADQIAGVIDGTISPTEIGSILAAQGIDPSAIILPTADGLGVNGLGEALATLETTYNIPIQQISGIQNALEKASQATGGMSSISARELLQAVSSSAGVDITSQSFMDNLISGNIDTNALLEAFSSQGAGVNQLRIAGITSDTIDAIRSGSFNADQLMNFTRNIGLGGQALESLGLGKTSLTDIAQGSKTTQEYLQAAQAIGLDVSELKSMGLDAASLSKLQESGSASSASTLAENSSGASPDTINIPVPTGTPLAPESSSIPPAAVIGETCSNQQSLLTAQDAPNYFGDDTATIDMAISQGDPLLFEESISDAMRLAATNQAHIIARSIQLKSILTDALEAIDSFTDDVDVSESLDQDWTVNGAIKTQLLMAQAEVTSLYTYLASADAARQVSRDNFTPIPTFPHNSVWEETVATSANQKSTSVSDRAKKSSQAADDYSDFNYQTKNIQNDYGLMERSIAMQQDVATLQEIVMEHETIKSNLMILEELIRNSANEMFVHPAEAAELILSDLKQAAGEYGPEERWVQSNESAKIIEDQAKSLSSPYGTRVIIMQQQRDEDPIPAPPSPQPFSYPVIDSVSEHDPYDIIKPGGNNSVREGEEPPYILTGLFQYYMETYRREAYEGASRRGVAPETMSLNFWDEMKNYSMECLIGPIETNEQNLEQRPYLFDLSPYCDHLIYQDGDSEDYISPHDLGGIDATIWRSKIEIDLINQITGGPKSIIDRANQTLASAETAELMDNLTQNGLPQWPSEMEETLNKLTTIVQNPDFQAHID